MTRSLAICLVISAASLAACHRDESLSETGAVCSESWYRMVDEKLPTSDGAGHGPGVGSDEWKSAVEFKLGIRGEPDVPERNSEAWCRYVDQLVLRHAAGEAPSELAVTRRASDAGLQWGPCPEFFPAGCQIAALHGDPAKPNADVFFRVPAQYDLPAHWHTSPERMLLVSGELHVSYDGQDAVVLRPGSYAYGPAKAVHRGRCASQEPCVLFIAFEGPVDAIPATSTNR